MIRKFFIHISGFVDPRASMVRKSKRNMKRLAEEVAVDDAKKKAVEVKDVDKTQKVCTLHKNIF